MAFGVPQSKLNPLLARVICFSRTVPRPRIDNYALICRTSQRPWQSAWVGLCPPGTQSAKVENLNSQIPHIPTTRALPRPCICANPKEYLRRTFGFKYAGSSHRPPYWCIVLTHLPHVGRSILPESVAARSTPGFPRVGAGYSARPHSNLKPST